MNKYLQTNVSGDYGIYAIFYSSYIHFATQRDNPIENGGGSDDRESLPEDENGGN